jgi:hypothetical protein
VSNTIEVVRQVVQDLSFSGFRAVLFGGWAEELLEHVPPREHADIDLLVFDADQTELDVFVQARGEIRGKHFSHKRAFVFSEVMVELFLVRDGRTTFWNTVEYAWPTGHAVDVDGLPVAPAEYLTAYRRDYPAIRSASSE